MFRIRGTWLGYSIGHWQGDTFDDTKAYVELLESFCDGQDRTTDTAASGHHQPNHQPRFGDGCE